MSERNLLENVVRAIYAARNDNDVDAIVMYLDPGFSFRIAGSGRLGTMALAVNTPETVRGMFVDLIEKWDLSGMETVATHIDGDTVIAHRVGSVRFIPSETRERTEIIDKFTFRNGRIVDLTEFVDTLFVAETVGLLSTPAYSSSTRDKMSL